MFEQVGLDPGTTFTINEETMLRLAVGWLQLDNQQLRSLFPAIIAPSKMRIDHLSSLPPVLLFEMEKAEVHLPPHVPCASSLGGRRLGWR